MVTVRSAHGGSVSKQTTVCGRQVKTEPVTFSFTRSASRKLTSGRAACNLRPTTDSFARERGWVERTGMCAGVECEWRNLSSAPSLHCNPDYLPGTTRLVASSLAVKFSSSAYVGIRIFHQLFLVRVFLGQ